MKIGFIGIGNMGGALATAAAKAVGGDSLLLTDLCTEKLVGLAAALGATATDTATLVAQSDYIFLGVKPQVLERVLTDLRPALANRVVPPVFITMAAGVPMESVRLWVGGCEGYCPIIRIMPNTPVAVGAGMVLYALSPEVTAGQKADFCRILSAAGKLSEMPEKLIDAGTAVSGCGPAFAALFIEALADGGVECGLPRGQALELAVQTVLGTARQLQATESHPAALKDAVCSPGGSTIAGVHALEAGGFRSLAMDAVTAAYERTQELAK